ncbi:LysR family transcriptional regulator [Micromonospora sp. NPDC047762]|uniref:LysR family transcriptional regulator n=1 Tax=Micromonospora sp. NPDC047762 TaxID=3364255 RepID=UPI003724AE90
MASLHDLGRLRALHAVAAFGSISGAASALGYTPSAVSQQIAKLEREAGAPLLDRAGRRVALTPAGQILAQTAGEVLVALERAETRLKLQHGTPTGRLTLAAFPTACRGLLPDVLVQLTRRHPGLDLRVSEVDPLRGVDLVAEGEVDVAVVHDWHNTPLVLPDGLRCTPLGDDVADVLLPAGHPLAGRDEVSADDLVTERWISQRPGSMCHAWLLRTFAERGRQPDIACQVDEYQSQVSLVAAGLGVALLPRLGRGRLPSEVVALPLRPTSSRQIMAVWRASTSDRPAITAALDALHEASAAWTAHCDFPNVVMSSPTTSASDYGGGGRSARPRRAPPPGRTPS